MSSSIPSALAMAIKEIRLFLLGLNGLEFRIAGINCLFLHSGQRCRTTIGRRHFMKGLGLPGSLRQFLIALNDLKRQSEELGAYLGPPVGPHFSFDHVPDLRPILLFRLLSGPRNLRFLPEAENGLRAGTAPRIDVVFTLKMLWAFT